MAICVALGLFLGNSLWSKEKQDGYTPGNEKFEKMQDVIGRLDKEYVDPIDGDELFEKAMAEMLHDLNPHNEYIPAKDLKRLNEGINGNFGGIGIRFFIIRDTVCVTNVLPYSPSKTAGLKAGDKILKVDGKKIAGKKITNERVMGLLKGTKGKKVQLLISRKGKKLKKTVIRGTIPVSSVTASYMVNDKIGFIKIESFSVQTAYEFRRAATILKKRGMTKLILDLRNNGGGVLTSATEIADEFLPAGKLILKTKGKSIKDEVFRSSSRGNLKNVKVAVLINSTSASASEILAGAIQDNDRGTVIGRRSFGKGLVQKDVKLRDGSNLRIVIARYYTPTGRCIQKSYSDGYEEYTNDRSNRYESGEMYEVDSTLFVDSLKFRTPKGKIVYGGGGIMPDIFVPLDSTGTSWYLSSLSYSSAFQTFAFDYVQNKRKKWKSPGDFAHTFEVSDALVEQFVKFAESEKEVPINRAELNHSKENIKRFIKGAIARQIWVEQGYYVVNNKKDVEVQKAIEHLD